MEKIDRRLQSIELRLSQLESFLNEPDIAKSKRSEEFVQQSVQSLDITSVDEEDKGLEAKIGRFGLAWLGNIVLLFGIAFLTSAIISFKKRKRLMSEPPHSSFL